MGIINLGFERIYSEEFNALLQRGEKILKLITV